MNVRMLYIPAHRFHKPSKRINPQIKLTNKQTKKQQRKKKRLSIYRKENYKKKKKNDQTHRSSITLFPSESSVEPLRRSRCPPAHALFLTLRIRPR